MSLDDVAADRQPEPGAALAGGVGADLGGEERLEDPPQVGRRDADAGVGDAQLGQPAGGVKADPDGQTTRGAPTTACTFGYYDPGPSAISSGSSGARVRDASQTAKMTMPSASDPSP